ncbi:MAG: hypothetical protein ACXV2J_14120, partial [Actinomycetes bacterium]
IRLAVVAVHRLADVALHVTLTRPFGEDARCLECCLDDLTRLVIAPARVSPEQQELRRLLAEESQAGRTPSLPPDGTHVTVTRHTHLVGVITTCVDDWDKPVGVVLDANGEWWRIHEDDVVTVTAPARTTSPDRPNGGS